MRGVDGATDDDEDMVDDAVAGGEGDDDGVDDDGDGGGDGGEGEGKYDDIDEDDGGDGEDGGVGLGADPPAIPPSLLSSPSPLLRCCTGGDDCCL